MGEQFADSAAEQGVKVIGGQRMRLVTHLDIDEEDIAKVIASFRAFFAA
jgi:threonine aldolase